MKKNIIGSIAIGVILAFTLVACPKTRLLFSFDNRKPVISIADLMIDKITHSPDSSANTTVNKLINLRSYDTLFYKALFYGSDLPNMYFYSRRGSCCPCNPGGNSCCNCSKGAALGIPEVALPQARGMRKIDRGSAFMFASMSPPQVDTLTLNSKTIDAMKIFTVPDNTPPGTYQVFFQGNFIDLTLVITIDANQNIEISGIQ